MCGGHNNIVRERGKWKDALTVLLLLNRLDMELQQHYHLNKGSVSDEAGGDDVFDTLRRMKM